MDTNLILNKKQNIETTAVEEPIYTIFEIENKLYALNSEKVGEILRILEISYPNKMLSCFLGFIEFNEKPINIIDLREVFKLPRKQYSLNSKIIIYNIKNDKIAFVCDKVIDVKKLSSDKISPMPYQEENFYKGLYINNKDNIYILSGDGILKYIEDNQELFKYKEDPNNFLPSNEDEIEILKNRRTVIKTIASSVDNQPPLYDMGVSFSINDVKYYINMSHVKEFYKVNNSKFTIIPNVPDFIFGLINIKGEFITILDLRRFYNNSKTTLKEKSTIIILNSGEYKIGILADEILENININYEEIVQNKLQKQEENSELDFVKNNEIYQIVDINQLLQDDRLDIC